MSSREDLFSFVLEKTREGVVVYDGPRSVCYRNTRAKRFLERHDLPGEVSARLPELFDAIASGRTAERFPGEICFPREIAGRRWVFRVAFRGEPRPLVCVLFLEETVSGRFDLNAVRQQYRLTRREADALRHLLDGLSNLEIAEELGVVEQTVKDYVSSVYAKIGVQSRFELLRCLLDSSPPGTAPLPA